MVFNKEENAKLWILKTTKRKENKVKATCIYTDL